MKVIFETEDDQEHLVYSQAPRFYSAIYEILEFLRSQDKYGFTLGDGDLSPGVVVGLVRDRIIQIVGDEAPSYGEIL